MNGNKLRARMIEAGYTQGALAQAIGKSENTLSRKMTRKIPFTTDEVLTICDCLHITDNNEKAQIFLHGASL